jgi:hypothetical protein
MDLCAQAVGTAHQMLGQPGVDLGAAWLAIGTAAVYAAMYTHNAALARADQLQCPASPLAGDHGVDPWLDRLVVAAVYLLLGGMLVIGAGVGTLVAVLVKLDIYRYHAIAVAAAA